MKGDQVEVLGKDKYQLGPVRRDIRPKTKEKNLVSNRKVELRGHVKAKIHPAVHRNI